MDPEPGAAVGALTAVYSSGEATDEEQYYLELINRARADPAAEGARFAATTAPDVLNAYSFFGVDLGLMQSEFAQLPVRPPLAMNAQLLQAARGHSQDMFANAFQGHGSTNGDTMEIRAANAGYPYTALAENVYAEAASVFQAHAGFQVDWGFDLVPDLDGMQEGRGHRANIHSGLREAGIGVVLGTNTMGNSTVGPQLVTQNFGTSNTGTAFVLGVAYYDFNGNSFYDPGEGIGGLTISVEGSDFHAVTTSAGGYAVPVPLADASRAVTFSGLGLNGAATAVISDGDNVKVDFTPLYVPPAVSGPDTASTIDPTNYSFNPVGGATGYDWRRVPLVPAAADGANDLTRVSTATTGTYSPLSTSVKHAGAGCYRLAHPIVAASQETVTYDAAFFVQADASVTFRSRLGFATSDQHAKVQVSSDGGASWTDVYSQAGTGAQGETTFQLRTVSLAAFAGMEIRLRFNYTVGSGSLFTDTGNGVGWYIDEVSFTNILDFTDAVTAAVPPGTEFAFTAPAPGDFLLAVRPLISGRAPPFGPPLTVTVPHPPPEDVDITVQQPAGINLVDAGSTVAFGPVALGASAVRTFTLVNSGVEQLTDLAVTIGGAHAAEFADGALGALSLNSGDSTTFTVTFTPAVAGARTATLHIASNDPNESPFDIELTGTGDTAFQFIAQPDHAMVVAGAAASFSASALPLPVSFQWRRNGAQIANETDSTLTISEARLSDAGAYTVVVTKQGLGGLTSNVAQLGVVEDVPRMLPVAVGGTAKITVNAAGSNLTFLWKRNDEPLPPDPRITGSDTKTLSIKGTSLADTDIYTCEVTGPGGTATGGTTDLRIFDTKPDLTGLQGMPDGIVSGSYTHQILLDGGANQTPTTFTVTGLPAGLKVDPKTGFISGKPAKAGEFTVRITAKNSKGSDATTDTITIAAFPDHLTGVYAGPLTRDPALNGNLGGRFDMAVTATGAFTGSLTLGAAKHAIKGALEVELSGTPASPSATVEIKRTGGLPPLTLTFTVVPAVSNTRILDGKVTDDTNSATFTAWRQVWHAATNPATPVPKVYTFGLDVPAGLPDIPMGSGFGSLKLSKDGKVTLTGKTADGETITGSGFVGPHGEVVCFKLLYTTNPKGSLLGTLDLDPLDTGALNSDKLDGTISWLRPPNPATKARTYKAGFDPFDLNAFGARYVPPVAPAQILSLAEPGSADNAELIFRDGGLPAAIDPDVSFDVGPKSKITMPLPGLDNPGSVKLTVATATGTFSGSFILVDGALRRTVKFQGILTRDETDVPLGVGFFLLPQIPEDGETPATSPILSGSVTLQAVP